MHGRRSSGREPFTHRTPDGRGRFVVAPLRLERNRFAALSVTVGDRELDERRVAAARRPRAPGEGRDRERRALREPRADVRLDGRGARERARGERRVHVVPCALDHRRRAARRARARSSTATTMKRLELGALFHDIGKIGIPSEILRQARPAHRRGVRDREGASRARREDPRADRAAGRRAPDRARVPRAVGRRAATRTATRARRSRSSRGSSSSATRSTR